MRNADRIGITNYPGDGPELMQVSRLAAEKNMLVLNHYWKPEVLNRIAGSSYR